MTNSRRSSNKLFVIFLTLTGFALSAYAVPPLILTMSSSFHMRFENFGYLFLIQYISFALASYTGVYLRRLFRMDKARIVILGLTGCSVILIVTVFIKSFTGLLIWAFPLGYFGGLVETFSSVLLTDFEKRDSSRVINLSQIFFCIGALGAPQIIALLLHYAIGWRTAFVILAACILCVDIFFFFLFAKNFAGPRIEAPGDESTKPPENPRRNFGIFFISAGLAIFSYVVIEIGGASWIAAFFEKSFRIRSERAALSLSLYWFGILLGRALMLIIPAKHTLWTSLIAGCGLMTLSCLFLSLSGSMYVNLVFVTLYGIGAGPIWPSIVMISNMTSRSDQFTAGIIGIGAIGAAVGPFIVSYLIRGYSIERLFFFFFIGCTFMLLAIILFKLAHTYYLRRAQ